MRNRDIQFVFNFRFVENRVARTLDFAWELVAVAWLYVAGVAA